MTSYPSPATGASVNRLLPVFLELETLQVLLVGAGRSGYDLLQVLLSNSPQTPVTVVAPIVEGEVKRLVSKHPLCRLHQKPFDSTDLEGKDIVILATRNAPLNDEIYLLAREKGLLVHTVDDLGLSDFYVGPIVRKGNLKIAVSTNGKGPVAADRIREVLEQALPGELDVAIENLHQARHSIHADLQYRARKLNALARTLQEREDAGFGRRWIRIATYSSLAFVFMIIGYFIFSYLPVHAMTDATLQWYRSLDSAFPLMVLAGFLAQLVDGALGMGYGVTSATILLSAGVNPAAISGSIHTAEMFASGASGYSHYKFGNVNKKLFKTLLLPGILGAIGGAVLLVLLGNQYGNYIRPVIAAYTLVLGVKFIFNAFRERKPRKKFRQYRLLAGVGGFFDSFGGGGWGPIVTSTLINTGRSHKYAVGTVSLTEFFVTLASAFTFFAMIGVSHWQTILALILGGLVAAPIAAKLAGKLPKKTAYLLLGVLVIFWSLRILVKII